MALGTPALLVVSMRRICALVVAACVATGCGPEVSARAVPATTVDSVDSIDGDARATVDTALTKAVETAIVQIPAVVFSDLDADLGARMAGVVERVEVELGDAVREGQVLLVLDDARERARVESATAVLDRARAEYTRTEGLFANGFVTSAQMDEAKYDLRLAESALRAAQVDLDHTRVIAPFSGVITRRMTGRGRPVEVGEPLFRLTALQALRALVRVPEREARSLRRGAPAVLTSDDGTNVAATVQRISPATDPESGTVEVLLEIPRPGPLRPGSSALARLRQ